MFFIRYELIPLIQVQDGRINAKYAECLYYLIKLEWVERYNPMPGKPNEIAIFLFPGGGLRQCFQ